jgi:hypothetical protein
MKTFLFLILICLSSCAYKHAPNYHYDWTVKVTYTNSDIDTIKCGRNSFNGNEAYIFLKISEPGILVTSSTAPCLVTSCGFYQDIIVCGVRKFEILSIEKTLMH